jgi:predicted Zn-dependent protease
VIVLGGIGAGLWWLYQNTGSKLLQKAELSIRAGKYDKALEQTGKYMQEKPGDWQGPFYQAQAYVGLAKYDDARASLAQAGKLNPAELSVPALFAETYAAPARKAVNSKDLSAIRTGIEQFRKAEESLAKTEMKDANKAIGVQAQLGLMQAQTGRALRILASRAEDEALGVAGRSDSNIALERHNDSNVAMAESNQAFAKATHTLLAVVAIDANRPDAAGTLVELCMVRNDVSSLAAARKAILAASDPPPDAVVGLAGKDLQASSKQFGRGLGLTPEANEACGALDRVIAKHPDNIQAKAMRADLAGRLSDSDKVKSLHKEIVEANVAAPDARLIQANILLADGNLVEAEQKISKLKSEFAQAPSVQYAYARLALATGKADMAAEALKGLSKFDSADPQFKLVQAQLALRLSDLPAARQYCDEAVKADPNGAEGHRLRGVVLTRLGDLARAEADLSSLDKTWPAARIAYSRLAIRKGDMPSALAAAQDAARLDPENDEARGLLAELEVRAGGDANSVSPAEAFASAAKYYQSHVGDPGALRLFVMAAHRADKDDLAREEMKKAAAGSAGPQLLMLVSEGYATLKDEASSMEAAKRAAEATPNSTDDRMAMALALERLHRGSEAVQLLSDEVRKTPGRPDLRFQLGRLLAGSGMLALAIDQYRSAVDLDQGNADYHMALAKALQNSGDIDGARKVLDEMGSSRASADTDSSKAAMYLARRQWQECINLCKSHLSKDPNDTELLRTYALALLATGQEANAIRQWERAMTLAPGQLPTYLELAGALARKGDVDQCLQRMAAIPGAQPDLVNLAVGAAFLQGDEHDKALELLARVPASATASEAVAGQARRLLILYYSAGGLTDKALAEIDLLAKSKMFARDAMVYRIRVLIAAKRQDQADAALEALAKLAGEEKDDALLQGIPGFYVQMKQYDKALAVCDQLQKLAPNDSRTYQVRAEVLAASGKVPDAVESLRKAIELQPQNYSLQVALARILDAEQRSPEALEVLRKLEEAGPAAATQAQLQRGLMLARWGLYGPSADLLTKLANAGLGGSSGGLQLALAQDLIQLGDNSEAAEVLKQVPSYAADYARAQLLLASIAPTDDAKLKIIRALPKSESSLLEEMALQMRRGQPAEAVKAFRFVLDPNSKVKTLPPTASVLAVQAMFESGDKAGARDLALRVGKENTDVRLRAVAALYAMDDSPQEANSLLPKPEDADPVTALVGFCLAHAVKDAGAEKQWLDRFTASAKQADQAEPSALAPYHLLISLIRGETDQAKAALANVTSVLSFGKAPAAELVASAATNANIKEEAFVLLKGSLAITTRQAALARAWAKSLLDARKTNQWAAALAFRSLSDLKGRRQILDLLQPKDCPPALLMSAELAVADGNVALAADLFGQVARSDQSVDILMNQAANTENSGNLEPALALYRLVWQAAHAPTAANNAAYVMLRLYPKDAAKLAEAQGLAEEALKLAPQESSFRDTLGWIAYLRGNYEQAAVELRKAVAGSPPSPEIHYHMAMAESACGRSELARWHYMAAVSIGKRMTALGKPLQAGDALALSLSQEALDALGPSK